MTRWKFEELNKLCEVKGIPDAKLYQNSLQWRWQRAKHHAETANKIWSDHFLRGSVLRISIIPDEQDDKLFFSYEAQVESCAQSLHALADILAQIINIVVLRGSLKEDDVSIKTIQATLQKDAIAKDVIIQVNELLSDDAFRYIEAFCNTIKHRRIIMTNFHAVYGEDTRNEHGLIFEEFTFKGNVYPQTWSSDILEKYRVRVFEIITKIGLSINAYVSTL
jgi:hypothetical protein